jgi:hypothetical protein
MKFLSLFPVPLLVLTEIRPVAAPAGTFTLTIVVETDMKSDGCTAVFPNFTVFSAWVAPKRNPVIVTIVPGTPWSGVNETICGPHDVNIIPAVNRNMTINDLFKHSLLSIIIPSLFYFTYSLSFSASAFPFIKFLKQTDAIKEFSGSKQELLGIFGN